MAQRTIRVIMNGVTGRMGYRQHLVRSVLAIRDDGGVGLPDGERISVEPILVGRNAEKLAALAAQHGVADFTTNLDEALSAAERSYLERQARRHWVARSLSERCRIRSALCRWLAQQVGCGRAWHPRAHGWQMATPLPEGSL